MNPSPDLRAGRAPYRYRVPKDAIPPHSEEAEKAVLGLALNFPGSLAEFHKLPLESFYDLRHQNLFAALVDMHRAKALIDLVTVGQWLKDRKLLKTCGGLPYLMDVHKDGPNWANLPYYLTILREKLALRKLSHVCLDAFARIHEDGNVSDVCLGVQADLDTVSRLGAPQKQDGYKVWSLKDLEEYEPPAHLALVGDNEIAMGYDGVTLLAGPGSSGKSLAVSALALAAATGEGHWQGRKVHRKFRLLILQSENGARRLKAEFGAMAKAHPGVDLGEHVFISNPPEGGLPFHKANFRAWVREQIERLKPDLVVIDTWAAVATEDAAKEVVEKLVEIRSTFPAGDECPGLLIVAHTKKPRADEVRKGRGLAFQVSGSIALVNTARCVYMLLPWSDDPEDERVYWSCVKLNNGQMYPASVWKRRFGAAFVHDPETNPKDWGRADDDEGRAITEEHLKACFEKTPELRSGELVKKLSKSADCGESTAWRAVGEDGYLRGLLMRSAHGKLKLKEPLE